MQDFSLQQTQNASQIQVQKMSQKQIQAIKLISMNNTELRDEIYKFAEENPAFEITDDSFSEGIKKVSPSQKNQRLSSVHLGRATASGNEMSDNFQKMLESSPDSRETLKEHLLSQARMSHLSTEEETLCEKLINNLDENGWHFLEPRTLLDKNDKTQTEEFLNHCISIVQHFDPIGTCCKNIEESLEVQAKILQNKNPLASFILHGHLDLISPPETEKAIRKMQAFSKSQSKMAFLKPEEILDKNLITEKNVESAIAFIKTLNPRPAQGFDSGSQVQFVAPDCLVEKVPGKIEKDDFEKGLIKGFDDEKSENDEKKKEIEQQESEQQERSDFYFRVVNEKNFIPNYRIAPSFNEDNDFDGLKKSAQGFIDSLDFRNRSVLKTFCILVSLQKEFFAFGPEKLKPLTQKTLANLAGVHESSISRFADSKYLRCEWGTFPVKYFFTSGIKKSPSKINKTESEKSVDGKTVSESEKTEVSSETVKLEIKKILEEHKDEKKKLSDQKLADLLNEKGFKIARRTVAKYRSQLNIESSYLR